MKVVFLFVVFLEILKVFCSSHNHLNFETALLIFAAANEGCISNLDNCTPKVDENGKLIKVNIGNSKKADISEIITDLRYLETEDERNKYFSSLFNDALNIIKSKLNISDEDFEKLKNNEIELNEFEDKINFIIKNKDIFNKLIVKKDGDKDFNLFNSSEKTSLYLFPVIYGSDDNNEENSIDDVEDISDEDTIKDQNVSSEDIKYLRKNKFLIKVFNYFNDYNLGEENPLGFIDDKKINNNINGISDSNIDANVLKSMLYICKQVPLCGDRYFKGGNYNNHQFIIIKTEDDNTYHLIVKDSENERISHPLSIKENKNEKSNITYKDEALSELNYSIDNTYETKEIYYHDHLKINDHKDIKDSILETLKPKNGEKLEIKNKDEYDNKIQDILNKYFNEYNKDNKIDENKINLYKNNIKENLCNEFDKKMKELYGEEYENKIDSFIKTDEFDIFIEIKMEEIMEKSFFEVLTKGIIEKNFINKINSNKELYEGTNKMFDEVDFRLDNLLNNYSMKNKNNNDKNKLVKILYKIVIDNYDDFDNNNNKINILKRNLENNKEFEGLFYNLFVTNFVEELYNLDSDLISKIKNGNNEELELIKNNVSSIINNVDEKIINSRDKKVMVDKIYNSLKESVKNFDEELLSEILIDSFNFDHETVKMIELKIIKELGIKEILKNENNNETLKEKLNSLIKSLDINEFKNKEGKLIIEKIKFENSKEIIKELNKYIKEKELDERNSEHKILIEKKRNEIIENKINEVIENEINNCINTLGGNKEKYEKKEISSIIKNEKNLGYVYCRKAKEEVINQLNIKKDKDSENLKIDILVSKIGDCRKDIIRNNEEMRNEIKESLNVIKYDYTEQYVDRKLNDLNNNLINGSSNEVENVFKESDKNIYNDEYKKYDNFLKKINYKNFKNKDLFEDSLDVIIKYIDIDSGKIFDDLFGITDNNLVNKFNKIKEKDNDSILKNQQFINSYKKLDRIESVSNKIKEELTDKNDFEKINENLNILTNLELENEKIVYEDYENLVKNFNEIKQRIKSKFKEELNKNVNKYNIKSKYDEIVNDNNNNDNNNNDNNNNDNNNNDNNNNDNDNNDNNNNDNYNIETIYENFFEENFTIDEKSIKNYVSNNQFNIKDYILNKYKKFLPTLEDYVLKFDIERLAGEYEKQSSKREINIDKLLKDKFNDEYFKDIEVNNKDNRLQKFKGNLKRNIKSIKIDKDINEKDEKKKKLNNNLNVAYNNAFRETYYNSDNIKCNNVDFNLLNDIITGEAKGYSDELKQDIIYTLQKYTIFVPSAIENINNYLYDKDELKDWVEKELESKKLYENIKVNEKLKFNDNNDNNVERITGNYNRHVNYDSIMKGNDGYVEDNYIDFIASNGYILRNSKGDRYETFIPQYNDVDLGENLYIKIKGYRSKNNNRLNVNAIAKYLQNDKIIEIIVSSIIDYQKNTNLLEMLENFKDNKNINDSKKDDNSWVNNILKYNIVDIFLNAYDKKLELEKLKEELEKENLNDVKEKLINDYHVQLLIVNECLDKNSKFYDGENMDQYINILEKLRLGNKLNENDKKLLSDNLSKIDDQDIKKKIYKSIENDIGNAEKVAKKSSNIIKLINGEGKNIDIDERRSQYIFISKNKDTNKYVIDKNDTNYEESRAINLKEKMDNFNSEHDFNFFGNVPCDFYDRKKYNSLGNLTSDFVDYTIKDQIEKDNHNMKIKLELMSGASASNTHEQFVTVNNNGKNNAISIDRDHFMETNKSIKLKATVNNKKNNNNASCAVNGMKEHNSHRKRNSSKCYYVPNIKISIEKDNIENKKLSSYEKLSDQLAFAILTSGNENGSIAKELDEKGKLVPIKIKVKVNGEEQEISINELIPCLKNLKNEELDQKFNKLYEMAVIQYLEKFDLQYNEETNELYYDKLPEETIKKGNVLSHIVNPYNINERDEIEYFNLEPEKMNIHYSENSKLDEKFKEFVSNVDENDVKNIDVNNYDEVINFNTEEWESELESNFDENTKYLYKIMSIQCAKLKKCKEQFKNTDKDKLSFNIVNYASEEKGNPIDNYSLVIHNDETKQSMNAFTVKVDDSYEYKIDEINLNKEYSFEELSRVNDNKEVFKMFIDNEEYCMRPGIGLVAECEFEFRDSDGNIIKPDQYAVKNSDDRIINDEIIEKKYGVENNGKYDMNLVRIKALDLNTDNISNNDLENISFKEVGKLMINKRSHCNSNEHCNLSDYEIETFNNYSNILLKNDLSDEENGVVHYTNEKDFNSNYNDIKETVNIQNEMRTIRNHKSGCLSGNSNLRKRAGNGGKCLKCIEVSKNYGVEDHLISSLNILKKYDSKNIKVKENEKSISNPRELCTNAETFTDIISTFLESYESIGNMNKEDSEKMIIKLQEFVKGLDFRYKNSNYLSHESIRDINKYDINDMMGLCNDLLEIHESKFGKITDSKGKTIGKISEMTSDIESESKYVNDELHEVLNNVHDVLNEYYQDISNVNLVDDIDLDNKSGRDERTYEVTYILDEMENMNISGSKESKEKIKSNLLKIFDRLIELEKVIDKANFNNDEFVNNSEMIYKLNEGIVNKLEKNFSEDKEVQSTIKIFRDNINGIKKANIKSSNVLNSDHIISQVNMEDYIFNDSRSKMYVKMYFDKIKSDFYEIDTEEGYEGMNRKVNAIKDKINEKIKQFNNYNKFEGNYQEAYHLVELINNYNELVSTVLSNDRDNSEINYIYISNDSELDSRLNYVRLNTKQKTENKILKSNPKQFNNKGNKKIEDIIDKNMAKKYAFGIDVITEGTYSDYVKVMIDRNEVSSNVDVLNKFVDSSTNNNQLIGFKQSYNLGYKLTMNELSDYRDEDMVNSINHLESSKKIFNNIKNNNIRYFETSKQTEARYKNDLLTIVELNNIKPEDVSIDDILYTVNARDLTDNMNEDEVSAFENQIRNVCMYEKNELVKYSGNTPGDSFEEIHNGYDSFSSKTILLLKKIGSNNSNNNNNNDEYYKKLKTNTNLVKHNYAYVDKLSKTNPVNKRPPTNKHKLGNKYKRNMNNIKNYY